MPTELRNKKTVKTLLTVAFCISLSLNQFAQTTTQMQQKQTGKLSAADNALVQSSKAAIVGKGLSASYFDEHFKVERVVNTVGDRRVMWKFSVGEYEVILNDAVGYYTDDKGQRINLHAIGNMLSNAHDIKSTIPKKRAEQLMTQCLGKYTPGAIVFQAFGTPPRASLLFTASSIPMPLKESKEEEREKSARERVKEKREKSKVKSSNRDAVMEEDEGDDAAPLIYTGFIDLETGACTKGVAQADHPQPVR
jgi:hypothetical protein